ncbi:MAG TPA: polysaccharide biosynthesis protein, partial [Hyphomicrobiales bacterium]|nr:polysaccharide biosynthesis protein [Hyphomicrobiales bacterium]
GFEPDKDIPIEITGIRPGERLQEELLRGEELVSRINVEGVFAAKPRSVPLGALTSVLMRIEAAAREGEEAEMMRLIGDLVPDYSGRPVRDGNRKPEAADPDAGKLVYLAKPGQPAAG